MSHALLIVKVLGQHCTELDWSANSTSPKTLPHDYPAYARVVVRVSIAQKWSISLPGYKIPVVLG